MVVAIFAASTVTVRPCCGRFVAILYRNEAFLLSQKIDCRLFQLVFSVIRSQGIIQSLRVNGHACISLLETLTGITMLQKTTQWITDRLVERALPSIGSFMASALQRMLILGHAEHHNQLEDQARRYEAAGKPHLAKLIRDEAQQLSLSDPYSSATSICERLTDESLPTPGLPIGLPDATPPKKKRSKKSAAQPQIATDQDGELAG